MTRVVDSSGWIEYLADGPLAAAFAPYLAPPEDVLTPAAVLYEVYRWARREGGDAPAMEAVDDPQRLGGTLTGQARWPRRGRVAMLLGAREAPRRGKSGHRRAGRWLTASRGNPRESATESRPPAAPFEGCG